MKRSTCPIACVLDILGDKWTLVILRDALFHNFTTFGQFQSAPENIASNILATRLRNMVESGLFERVKDEQNKLKVHYLLTEKGRDLKEILIAVGTWGNRHIEGSGDVTDKINECGGKS